MIDELVSIGLDRNLAECFYSLPCSVKPEDCSTADTLKGAFKRVLQSLEARLDRDVVFIWTVHKPYRHRDAHGQEHPSRIVYVEQTKHSVYERWPNPLINRLTTDHGVLGVSDGGAHFRMHAKGHNNLMFYTNLVRACGPLTVGIASAARLNFVNNKTAVGSGPWEGLILEHYRRKFHCLPLKNKRGASSALLLGSPAFEQLSKLPESPRKRTHWCELCT